MKKFHIQWHITSRCNIRCKHCYQERFDASEDICFPDIQKLFNNLCLFLERNRLELSVDITGGEPFTHPDFWKILEMLEKSEAVENCGIITNGTFLQQETLRMLSRFSKVKTLKVSCEGAKKDYFEYFRKLPYKKFVEILEVLAKFHGEKTLMFTLLETNASQIPLLFDVVDRYNLDGFIVERFFPIGTGRQIKDLALTRETWKNVVMGLLTACGMPQDLELVAEYRGFKIIRKNGWWEILGAMCVLGKYGCAIMHNGDIYPCRRFNLKIGNALMEDFNEIWQRNIFRKLKRRNLKGICRNCNIRKCYGCRALAYCIFGDYFAHDPLCFIYPEKDFASCG